VLASNQEIIHLKSGEGKERGSGPLPAENRKGKKKTRGRMGIQYNEAQINNQRRSKKKEKKTSRKKLKIKI